ncbi:hypothetical protein EDB86DRAFT_1710308 [Lactarius hatsudake]|nr:hypothetical protein EDB86DRAFT_1710308 [Lactarius hatsudake]
MMSVSSKAWKLSSAAWLLALGRRSFLDPEKRLPLRCGLLGGANEWPSPQSTEAFKFQEKDTDGKAVVVRLTGAHPQCWIHDEVGSEFVPKPTTHAGDGGVTGVGLILVHSLVGNQSVDARDDDTGVFTSLDT